MWMLLLALAAGAAPNQTITRALALLATVPGVTTPTVVAATVRPDIVDANAEGWVAPGYPVVYVATWSATYKRADNGDRFALIKLAGVIGHEAYHVAHGPAEGPAYDEQMRVLEALHAPHPDVASVKRAREVTVRNAAHGRKR